MDLEERILTWLSSNPARKAREIAAKLGMDHHEVNSMLYRLKNTGKVVKDEGHCWSLIQSKAKNIPYGIQASPTIVNHKPVHDGSPSMPTHPAEIKWTGEQECVIDAEPPARIMVEAGPGTGKTAVACARVAKLLREDELNPGSILMISFTRTAVAEMKNRIRQWADSGKVGAVNISTLDQAAFSFGVGCGTQFEKLMGSFEGNITNAIREFEKATPLLVEYLGNLRHVIIDEAQDLTGSRSKLARLLIGKLPNETGVTIFADQDQAIYGFTTDIDDDAEANENFLAAFKPADHGFTKRELQQIHRTQNAGIFELFFKARTALREGGIEEVLSVAQSSGGCLGDEVKELPLRQGDLLLYRKRASALMHAQFCPVIFSIRLPNHPSAVFPWIGLALSSFSEPVVSEHGFGTLWDGCVPPALRDGFDVSSAWSLLRRFCKAKGGVDLVRLRKLLSRPRPPVEFCYLDYGGTGPVFSTIHASKGREADRVFLMLPKGIGYLEGLGAVDREEEARVFYVGATRVKSEFLHGKAHTMVGAGRLDQSGRRVAQILKDKWKPKFQLGLQDDFDDLAPISRNKGFCSDDKAAEGQQGLLVSMWAKALESNVCPDISATCVQVTTAGGQKDYRYRFDFDESTVAWSGHGLAKDLWTACSVMKDRQGCGDLKPPDKLEHLRFIGLRTCAAADDPAILGNLREPYASSGFWLAPMIVGFPSIFLKFKNTEKVNHSHKS